MDRKIKITKKFLIKEYIKNRKTIQQISNNLGYKSITMVFRYLKKYKIKKIKRFGKEIHNYLGSKSLYRQKNHCIDCGKKVKCYRSKRCYSCENKRKHRMGIINKNHKEFYCIECGKEISRDAKRCWECNRNFIQGKNHHSYKPEKHKKHYCKEKGCNNEICYVNWKDGSKRCRKCAGKKHSKEMKLNPFTAKTIAKHHIYLKENNNKTLKLTYSKHAKLHSAVYEYLYIKHGKKGIDDYLKWFDKKYGLGIIK